MTPNRFPTPCVEWKPVNTLENLINPSFYWAHVLLHTLSGIRQLGIPPVAGALFVGPPGNGKHMTADALAGSLAKKHGCCCLRINGAVLDTEDVADACAVLDAVSAALRTGKKICLLLDSPELSRHCRAVQEYLYQMLMDWSGKLFPILITPDPAGIDPNLLQQLPCCPCPNPDLATREKWLQSVLTNKGVPINILGGMNHTALAGATEGFSWKKLSDLRTMMRRTIAMKYFRDPQIYNPELTPGMENTIWREGKIPLTVDEVNQILILLRYQSAPVVTGAVQYVAAPAAVSAVAAPGAAAPAAGGTAVSVGSEEEPAIAAMDQKAMEAAKAKHSNPENLALSELFDIDDF